MSDVKAQLEIAAKLIRSRQYDTARELLKTIDHPKAREWLNRLDEIAPEVKSDTPSTLSPKLESTWAPKSELKVVPEVAPEKKRSRSGATGCLFFLVFVVLCTGLPRLFSDGSPLSYRSTTTDIIDLHDTGIPEKFLAALQREISAYGYVDFYDAAMLSRGRLVAHVEVQLTASNPTYKTAYTTMEKILRFYASEFPGKTAAKISAIVSWEEGGTLCSGGVGMGSRVQNSINWSTYSWDEIVSALDQGRYTDNTSNIADIAWRPTITGLSTCRN